jgi:outer membrane protein
VTRRIPHSRFRTNGSAQSVPHGRFRTNGSAQSVPHNRFRAIGSGPGARFVVALLALMMLGLPQAAHAQAQQLTLEEALARGLRNSLRLSELDARREAAEAAEASRAASTRPLIALIGGYMRTNHVEEFAIVQPGLPRRVLYPDIPDNYRARVDLQWPIYTGGRADALERAARAEREAAGEDLAAARADLALEITRAFWASITAAETELVVARAVTNMDAHVRDLENQLKQGFIPPNEVLSAETQRSRQRLLAIEARATRSAAHADLRRLIGLDTPEPIEPVGALDTPGPIDPVMGPDGSSFVRPERRALEDRAEAAQARSAAARAARRPQLGLNAGYDYARPNPRIFPRNGDWADSWDVSVNGSWTVWDGGRRRAEEAEATAAARAAQARVGDFNRQVTLEITQRRLDVESSRAAIATAGDGVRSAIEAHRVVRVRLSAGVATSTDVLDAETALLQAELDRTRALANARIADARLLRALGAPSR